MFDMKNMFGGGDMMKTMKDMSLDIALPGYSLAKKLGFDIGSIFGGKKENPYKYLWDYNQAVPMFSKSILPKDTNYEIPNFRDLGNMLGRAFYPKYLQTLNSQGAQAGVNFMSKKVQEFGPALHESLVQTQSAMRSSDPEDISDAKNQMAMMLLRARKPKKAMLVTNEADAYQALASMCPKLGRRFDTWFNSNVVAHSTSAGSAARSNGNMFNGAGF